MISVGLLFDVPRGVAIRLRRGGSSRRLTDAVVEGDAKRSPGSRRGLLMLHFSKSFGAR